MILTVDAGNSHIVMGAFQEDTLQFVGKISSHRHQTADELAVQMQAVLALHGVELPAIRGSILSSVVPQTTRALVEAIRFLTKKAPLLVGPGIRTGIHILIDNPAQLGGDLLVDCVAAASLYPKPLIVIDMGTATSLSVVNEKNCMIGGAIAPGFALSLEALSAGTAQLPYISADAPKKAIGTNTIDCMRSGIVLGTASMLDGMIARFEEELQQTCFVVATGTAAQEICRHTKREIHYNPNLLLEGLYLLYQKNSRNQSVSAAPNNTKGLPAT